MIAATFCMKSRALEMDDLKYKFYNYAPNYTSVHQFILMLTQQLQNKENINTLKHYINTTVSALHSYERVIVLYLYVKLSANEFDIYKLNENKVV